MSTDNTAYLVVTLLAILASTSVAVAHFLRLPFVNKQASQLGVPDSWILTLGALHASAVAGLLLGLAGVPFIGAAAAGGLVLYFIGAIVMHRRAGDRAIGRAVAFLVLAVVTLLLALTTRSPA